MASQVRSKGDPDISEGSEAKGAGAHVAWNWPVNGSWAWALLSEFGALRLDCAYLHFVCWSFLVSNPPYSALKGGQGGTCDSLFWSSCEETAHTSYLLGNPGKGGFHLVWNSLPPSKNSCFLCVYTLRTRVLCLFGKWLNFWILWNVVTTFWGNSLGSKRHPWQERTSNVSETMEWILQHAEASKRQNDLKK